MSEIPVPHRTSVSTPSAAEALGLPSGTSVPELLGGLATRVEQSDAGGAGLRPDEMYAGRMLADDIIRDASTGRHLPDRASQDAGYVLTHRFGPDLDAAREEGITDPVVAANVAAMESPAMRDVLMSESVGGNAGGVEINGFKYTAGAVNGWADNESGLILAFGNLQDLDPAVMARGREFTLKVAHGRWDLSDRDNPRYDAEGRIVRVLRVSDFALSQAAKGTDSDLSDVAIGKIRDAARYYNKHYTERGHVKLPF